MEGTLQLIIAIAMIGPVASFNPCFSGRYSAIHAIKDWEAKHMCFNPCFSGRYSAISFDYRFYVLELRVSILVLVEGTLQSMWR